MSDSDPRVTPTLLRTVAAEFQNPRVGIATCPYRAVAGPSIWSRLEVTGMNTDFMAGILVAALTMQGVLLPITQAMLWGEVGPAELTALQVAPPSRLLSTPLPASF